jgi:hypothetical protein
MIWKDLQSSDPAIRAKAAKADVCKAIGEDLRSDDPARQAAAIEVLKEPKLPYNRSYLHSAWLEPLLNLKQYDLALELSDRGLQADCSKEFVVPDMTWCRVKTLLAAGKYEDALSAGKSYYNSCEMNKTRDAIGLIGEALANLHSKDEPDIVHRFRQQQEALAKAPDSVDGPPVALPADLGDNILAAIKIDSNRYDGFIKKASQGPISYGSLSAQGYLLLAADRGKEAQRAFQTAADMATDKQLPECISNIARAIRAQDGSVGRANAYILSLRKPAPQKAK